MMRFDEPGWVSPFDGMGLDEAAELWGQKERVKGPIEIELRQAGSRWWTIRSEAACNVWEGAILSVQLMDVPSPRLGDIADDVSSEAIEAAEALGL